MRMLRKQVYITEAQDRTLKALAQSLRLSEAEVLRRAIDSLSGSGSAPTGVGTIHEVAQMSYSADELAERRDAAQYRHAADDEAWQDELAFMRSLSHANQESSGESTWRFNREEVYEERLAKILRRH